MPSFIFTSSEGLIDAATAVQGLKTASARLMEQPEFLHAADATLYAMLRDLPRLAPMLGCDAQAPTNGSAEQEAQLGAYLDALRNNLTALLRRRDPSQVPSQPVSRDPMPQPAANTVGEPATPVTPGSRSGRANRSLQSPYTGMLQREIPQLLTGHFSAMLQTMKSAAPASVEASPASPKPDPAIASFTLIGQHLQSACRHANAASPVEAKAAIADAASALETFRSAHLLGFTRRLAGGDSVLPGPEERIFREQLRLLSGWIDELQSETSGPTQARDRAASSPMSPSRLKAAPSREALSPRKPDGLLSTVRKRFFSADARSPQRPGRDTGHRRGASDGAAASPLRPVAVRFENTDSPVESPREPQSGQDG